MGYMSGHTPKANSLGDFVSSRLVPSLQKKFPTYFQKRPRGARLAYEDDLGIRVQFIYKSMQKEIPVFFLMENIDFVCNPISTKNVHVRVRAHTHICVCTHKHTHTHLIKQYENKNKPRNLFKWL